MSIELLDSRTLVTDVVILLLLLLLLLNLYVYVYILSVYLYVYIYIVQIDAWESSMHLIEEPLQLSTTTSWNYSLKFMRYVGMYWYERTVFM